MGAKTIDHAGNRTMDRSIPRSSTAHSVINPFLLLCCNQFFQHQTLVRSERITYHSKMKNESVKKTLEKSKNFLEDRKNSQATNSHKERKTRLQ